MQPTIDLDVTMPTAPTLALPAAPLIHGITLPSLPTITFPTFEASLPELGRPTQYVPGNIAAQVGDVTYDTTLLDAFAEESAPRRSSALVSVTTQEALRPADLLNAQADRDVLVWDEFRFARVHCTPRAPSGSASTRSVRIPPPRFGRSAARRP